MNQDDRIKVSVEYPSLWLGMEISLAPGEDPIAAFIRTKATVDEAYKSMSSSPSHLLETQVEKTPKEAAIDSQIEAIRGCTSLKSLEIFKKLVDRKNIPRLTDAYDNKLKNLKHEHN